MLPDYIFNNFFHDKGQGIMVDVGAAGPEFISQSKYFRDLGWRCICFEPNPIFAQMHRDVNNEIYEYACSDYNADDVDFEIVTFVGHGTLTSESFSSLNTQVLSYVNDFNSKPKSKIIKVIVKTLDVILEESQVSEIDYIIIDVEGWELNVLKGFSVNRWNPKVIVLECLGDRSEIDVYMASIKYRFDCALVDSGPNLIYVRE